MILYIYNYEYENIIIKCNDDIFILIIIYVQYYIFIHYYHMISDKRGRNFYIETLCVTKI